MTTELEKCNAKKIIIETIFKWIVVILLFGGMFTIAILFDSFYVESVILISVLTVGTLLGIDLNKVLGKNSK